MSDISNSVVGDSLVYEREDTAPVGAGIEYTSSMGLRAEAMTNGDDASYGQVGVLYCLGIGSKKRPALGQTAACACGACSSCSGSW